MVEARRLVLLHNALGVGGGLDQAGGFVCAGERPTFCRLNLVTCRAPQPPRPITVAPGNERP